MGKKIIIVSFDEGIDFDDVRSKIDALLNNDNFRIYIAIREKAQEVLSILSDSYTDSDDTTIEHVLVEAEKIIHGQRRDDYGSAEKSFNTIWNFWEPVLKNDTLSGAEKVALCMIGLKIARYMKSRDRDSVVDIAGYAGCLGQINNWEG